MSVVVRPLCPVLAELLRIVAALAELERMEAQKRKRPPASS